jgi:hypothetical protein
MSESDPDLCVKPQSVYFMYVSCFNCSGIGDADVGIPDMLSCDVPGPAGKKFQLLLVSSFPSKMRNRKCESLNIYSVSNINHKQ